MLAMKSLTPRLILAIVLAVGLCGSSRARAEAIDLTRVQHGCAAEATERNVDGLTGDGFDEDIRRPQVLVQHPHRVHRGESGRDFRDYFDPFRERDSRQATAALGPIDETPAADVLRLGEERPLFQIPIEQSNDLTTPAERIVENSKSRDFTLERAQ